MSWKPWMRKLAADRYNAAMKQRERLCRKCESWLPIGLFPLAQGRRRRVCSTCRTDQNRPSVYIYKHKRAHPEGAPSYR